jgi:competence protein ComEC
LEHGDFSFIFTGDAERQSELEMLQHNLSAYVLHVGHHASRTSTTQEFLDAVNPTIAVISVGENNYGHPHGDIIDRFDNAGISVYRTDYHGNIVIRSDGSNITVRSQYNAVSN